jgi:hypothetical protein
VTPEQQALRDAYLAELWPTCRELPVGERAGKRRADREMQRELEDREAAQALHHGGDDFPQSSTGCAQNCGLELSGGDAECA